MNATVKTYLSRRMLVVLLQGFSGGIPLALTGTTLQAWMKDQKVDIESIGLYSLVGLPYAFKFVWSPLIDRISLPFLGHRRGWLFASQLLLMLGIAGMGLFSPGAAPMALGVAALIVAFASASQDIVIDAYRVDSLAGEEYAAGLSLYTMGYRLAMIVSGALALSLADVLPWRAVYLAMAATMAVGLVSTLIGAEPRLAVRPPRTLREAVIEPLLEFLRRPGAFEILLFLIIYKLDTNLSVALMTVFFLGLDFTKTDIAAISKLFGMIATISGAFVAGAVMMRWPLRRALVVFGILQAVASLSFLSLAYFGKSHPLLVMTIGAENFCSGMGLAALGAFMMSLVNKRYSATQYALITSFMALSRIAANAPAGYLQKAVGWRGYFIVCTLIGIPGLLLLLRYDKWALPPTSLPAEAEAVPEAATLVESTDPA